MPQLITNTYGVPSYQEANPSVFSVVTFPFLFAVMFGDYGHGSLILFVGLCMVLGHDYLKNTAMRDVQVFRYLALMSGFFSCYNGLLYNEWFAIPYPWFNSCYVTDPLPTANMGYVFPFVDFDNKASPEYPLTSTNETYCVYPFGMDPTWFLDSNDILVVQNSMKMKISVIIAVMHMTMGIVVKGMNAVYFKKWIVFWFEVVTGIVILNGLFGWMDVLIFVKWFYAMNPYSTDIYMQEKINRAPSIITVMINNFLAMGKQPFVTQNGSVDVYLFPAQRAMSETLVVIVLLCVPFMLFVKPCSALCCPAYCGMDEYIPHEEHAEEPESNPNGEEQILTSNGNGKDVQADIDTYQKLINAEKEGHANHSVNELFIHQLIETIEFVLGAVSNTASYLRLWALSLAHSQLALVFLQEILQVPWNRLPQDSIGAQTAGSFIIWFPFMAVSFAVLMMMDVLECFLHTLRLHWVEFQNKFFVGAGYVYQPFSFSTIFDKENRRA